MKMQKLGGYSAIAVICLVIILLVVALPYAAKYGLNEEGAGQDPAKVLAAASGSPGTAMLASILQMAISILGLLIVLGLYERMHAKAANLTRIMIIAVSASCALSIIRVMIGIRGRALMEGAADVSIFKPILMLQNGLNAASTNIEGWVLLLIAFAAIATRALPRFVAYVFLVFGFLTVIAFLLPDITGTAGIVVSIIAGLIWASAYVWLGIVMIKGQEISG